MTPGRARAAAPPLPWRRRPPGPGRTPAAAAPDATAAAEPPRPESPDAAPLSSGAAPRAAPERGSGGHRLYGHDTVTAPRRIEATRIARPATSVPVPAAAVEAGCDDRSGRPTGVCSVTPAAKRERKEV
ncbi:hypothetical protein GCM10010273_18180 [Streptomyces lavendulocolor]